MATIAATGNLFGLATFEDGKIDGFESKKGKVEVTTERFKSGQKSLKWDFTKDAVLNYKFDAPDLKKPEDGFGMWVYNPKAIDDRMLVKFFDGDKILAEVWYNLNFYGWRPVGANYAKLGIKASNKITRIEFSAPNTTGTLYFDSIRTLLNTKPLATDNQQPWVNDLSILKLPFAKSHYSLEDISLNRPYLPKMVKASDISDKSLADIKTVESKVLNSIRHDVPIKPANIEEIENEFAKLNIKKVDGIVTGPPVEWDMKGQLLQESDAISLKKQLLPIFRKIEWMVRNGKADDKEKAGAIGVLLVEYLLDQGYQENSGNLGWVGNGYGFRHLPPAIFYLKPYLKKAGIWNDTVKMTGYFSDGVQMFRENPTTSCDGVCNFTVQLLPSILLLDDVAEKYQRLQAFREFNNKIIANNAPFGNDGSLHHHGGHHLAYGSYALPTYLVSQLLPIEGTEFEINDKSVAKMHLQGYALAMQINKDFAAPNLAMRAGQFTKVDMSNLLCQLSLLRDKNNEMKAYYLYFMGDKVNEDTKKYKAAGIEPKQPIGHLTLNVAAVATHKRDDWSVSVAGMNNLYRGLEIYGWLENNNYSRFARNGSVLICKGQEMGIDYDGWNWNFWPGATSVVRPSNELYEGYTMFGNRSNMAGGVTTPDGNGVWGINFRGVDLEFRKSVFFYDNRVTVITSDVVKDSPKPKNSAGDEAVTTIFQQTLKGGKVISVDGKSIEAMPFEEKFDGKKAVTLHDTLNNGYYIWPTSTKLVVKKSTQEWLSMYKRYLKDPNNNPSLDIQKYKFKESPIGENEKYYNPTKGDFALAYFDMGKKPLEAKCAYTILVDSSVEATTEFAKNPTVEILADSTKAHIVRDKVTNSTGYVVFSVTAKLVEPLVSVSQPCFVSIRDNGDAYTISVAVSDPASVIPMTITFVNGTKLEFTPDYPAFNNFEVKK